MTAGSLSGVISVPATATTAGQYSIEPRPSYSCNPLLYTDTYVPIPTDGSCRCPNLKNRVTAVP